MRATVSLRLNLLIFFETGAAWGKSDFFLEAKQHLRHRQLPVPSRESGRHDKALFRWG